MITQLRGRRALTIVLVSLAALASVGVGSAAAESTLPFVSSFPYGGTSPNDIALDGDGNVYVFDQPEQALAKYDSSGNPASFAAAEPYVSGNKITGTPGGAFGTDGPPGLQIAVDRSGGPADGHIYVANMAGAQPGISVFDETGKYRGNIDLSPPGIQPGAYLCGVAVNQTNGNVHVADYYGGKIARYQPVDADPANYDYLDTLQASGPCTISIASNGDTYALGWGFTGSAVTKYPASQYGQPFQAGTTYQRNGQPIGFMDMVADPVTHHVFGIEFPDGAYNRSQIIEFDAAGNVLGEPAGIGDLAYSTGIDLADDGSLYVSSSKVNGPEGAENKIVRFAPRLPYPDATTGGVTDLLRNTVTLEGEVGPDSAGGGNVTSCFFRWGTTSSYGQTAPCEEALPFAGSTDVTADISGLVPGQAYHYRVVAGNSNGLNSGLDGTFVAPFVGDVTTLPATAVSKNGATFHGTLNPEGIPTTYYFQYGTSDSYGSATAAHPGLPAGSGSGDTPVSATVSTLTTGTVYHYRLVGVNADGISYGADRTVLASQVPDVSVYVSNVKSDGATLNAGIVPNGDTTSFRFEYGPTPAYGTKVPVPSKVFGSTTLAQVETAVLGNLTPGATYHYRAVATNPRGTQATPDRTFRTFDLVPPPDPTCSNALARQQTSAAFLPDCRAYELVSAVDTGGYDVESDLVPGGRPFGGFPFASGPSKVLYAVDNGAIPGDWNPTNFGPDPYVATRGDSGWATDYVGLPGDFSPDAQTFASSVGEASPMLEAFAFAGEDLCDPCFADGKRGIPVRTADGALIQGMAGSLDPGAGADAEILVRKRFSEDGRYLVFGSTSQFETDAPNGQPAIYRRDLEGGTTTVVSKTPGGTNLACLTDCATKGVAGLDISADGSRVVVGQLVGTDADGNDLWHLYMNLDGASSTVDLAPGALDGVSYAGMTRDGSAVFFTASDQLTSDDDDASVDLYRADLSGSSVDLTRLSTGSSGAGNDDGCNPVAGPGISHWNTDGGASCSVLAIAGAGGLAEGDGTVYFLSPEQLDGSAGSAGHPNLYVVRPGDAPRYVATLEPGNPAVVAALNAPELRRTADFQVTASGEFAVFASTTDLTGIDSAGFSQVFVYDAEEEALDCASCTFTGAKVAAPSALASNGRSVTEDGRVFFTTTEQLALRDTNGRRDVYQWAEGAIELISAGTGPSDSGLLSVSADGVDAYVFTRDRLVAEDENGQAMKVYDAREDGGFFIVPPRDPCAASDECHGPSSARPAPPDINTRTGSGRPSAPKGKASRSCRKGKVRKRGKCVPAKSRKAKKRAGRDQRRAR